MKARLQKFSLFILSFSTLFTHVYAACPAPGSGIIANGTTVTENGCTITTSAVGANGTNANLGGIINFSNGSITTTGSNARGAYANGTGSTITLTNIPIVTSAGGAYGAYADGAGATVNLNNVSISTASANGLFLNSGQIIFNTGSVLTTGGSTNGTQLLGTNASLSLDNVDMQVNGTAGVGLFVQLGGNTASATNCTITTTANGGRGVDVGLGAGAASSASLDNCIINVAQGSGPPSFGAIVSRNGSAVSVQDSTINSEVYGVHSIGSGASITVDNSDINVTANAAVFGAYAQNQTTITLQNNTNVSTTGGNNAHGLVIQDGSTGNLFDSSLQTAGTNAQGIFMIGFSANNQANISNSTVATSGSGASAITTFANAGITNTLQASNTTFSAANADLISIGGGIANLTFDNVSAQAAPNQLLLLVDGSNPATLSWTANSSSLSGDMQVIAGNTGNVTLGNSTWTGAALDVTNMSVNSSTWNLTANSTISNQLTNAGLIDFVSQGNTFKTLSIGGPYVGQNGTIGLNTFLGTDGSPSDLLIINGGTATGSTLLNIKNTTGAGELTVGDGILVVDAINGATTAVDAFALSDFVIAGPYEYTLFRGGIDGTDPDDWFLRSTFIPPVPPPVPPVPPPPNYRSEVSLYAALPSMALLYGRTLMDTLHQRVGEEERYCNPCLCPSLASKRFWARAINQGGRQNNGNIFHKGPDFDYQFVAMQMGVDVYRNVYLNGSHNHVGILGAVGKGSGNVKHFTGIHSGENEFDVYTAGAYWTYFDVSGWYLDGVFQANWYDDVLANSTRIQPLKTHGLGLSGSLETGYSIRFRHFTIEPQAQLVCQTLSLRDSNDVAAFVDFDRTNSTAGRVGIRLADTWLFGCLPSGQPRQLTAWVRASVWHDFQGNSTTLFSSEEGLIGLPSNLRGSWMQGDLGITAQLSDTLYFYGTFGGNLYLNGRGQAYTATAGLRVNF
jgi:outer membrane autotransporter protein